MSASKKSYACTFCGMILKDAVQLPCGFSLCNEHTTELKSVTCFDCKACSSEHFVPSGGFDRNVTLNDQIRANAHLSPLEQGKMISLTLLFNELEEKFAEFKLKTNEFEYVSHEHFADIERQIEIRRERLKMRIDDLSEEFLQLVKAKKKTFVDKSRCIEVSDLKREQEKDMSDLRTLVRQIDPSNNRFDQLEIRQQRHLDEIQARERTFEALTKQVEKSEFYSSFDMSSSDFGNFHDRLDYLLKVEC